MKALSGKAGEVVWQHDRDEDLIVDLDASTVQVVWHRERKSHPERLKRAAWQVGKLEVKRLHDGQDGFDFDHGFTPSNDWCGLCRLEFADGRFGWDRCAVNLADGRIGWDGCDICG
jgi:hypothetical protein